MRLPRPIVIVGPTAGGKSELAVLLAEALRGPGDEPGEVLGADSMQVYRHMNAGTAKPEASLQARVCHHLLDIVEPTERFTVADWLARAEPLIASLQARGVRPIIVGGTNLYLKALLEGMFEGPAIDEALRARLYAMTGGELHTRLKAIDPASAERIHPNDMKKLVRAIEVFELTGKPISAYQKQWDSFTSDRANTSDDAVNETPTSGTTKHATRYRHDPILIGLEWPVELINRRINARVKAFFEPAGATPSDATHESLIDEVRRIEAAHLLGPQAREALGYKQVLQHLAGECTLDDAIEQTKILTRRFAKTQRTWLKRYRGVHWLPADRLSPSELAIAALSAIGNEDALRT